MLKKWLILLSCLPMIFVFSHYGQAATLEERVDKLEKKVKRNKSSLDRKIDKLQEAVSIQGFLTAGLATHSGEGQYDNTEISDDLCFHCDSLLGVQMDFAMGEQYGSTVQFLAKGGSDKFELAAEWAYLYYKPTGSITTRFGRMRRPYYANSDFLDVGIAYPWARPPREVYRQPITAFEGADFLINGDFGSLTAQLQTYVGTVVNDTTVGDDRIEFRLDNAYGIAGTLGYGPFSIRLGAHGSQLNTDFQGSADEAVESLAALGIENVEVEDDDGLFVGLALTYDDGSFFGQFEWTQVTLDESLVFTGESISLTLGYKVGQFMPYVYYTTIENVDDNREDLEGAAAQIDAITAGLDASEDQLNAYNPNDPSSAGDIVSTLNSLFASQGDESLQALAVDIDTANGGSGFEVAQVASGLATTSATLESAKQSLFLANILEQTSIGLGVRYDVTAKTAIKFELQQVSDFGDDLTTKGLFQNFEDRDEDVTIISLVLNAVF